MSNSRICINKKLLVKNSGICCLAMIFNLSNPKMKILHVKISFDTTKHNSVLFETQQVINVKDTTSYKNKDTTNYKQTEIFPQIPSSMVDQYKVITNL